MAMNGSASTAIVRRRPETDRRGGVRSIAGPSLLRRLSLWSIGDLTIRQERVASLVLFALLIFSIVGLQLTAGKSKDEPTGTGQGDVLRQGIYTVMFVAMVLSSRVPARPKQLLVIPAAVTLILGWCWLSTAWAISPGSAARRVLLTTMIIWTLCQATSILGYERSLPVLRRVLLLTLVLNYLAVAFLPSGIHDAATVADPALAGNWRGVLPQKNFTGAVCVITTLCYVFDARRIPLWFRAGVIIVTGFMLYKTQSKTSVALLAASMAIGFAYIAYNPRFRALLLAGLAALAILVALLMQAYWDEILAPFTRQDSLTGRGEIWRMLLAFARANWVLGSGYGSFWNIGPDSPVYQYVSAKSWVAHLGNGHNGYLDLLVQIGLPGLILAIATLVVWPVIVLLTNTAIPRQVGALLLTTILFCAAHNMTETSLLDRDSVVQVLLMLATAMLASAVRPRPAHGT